MTHAAARRPPVRRFRHAAAANGFLVAPEQTAAFLAAIELLGPPGIEDIRRAAHATLAPPPDRRADSMPCSTRISSAQRSVEEPVEAEDDDVRVADGERGAFEPPTADEEPRVRPGRDACRAIAATPLRRRTTRRNTARGSRAPCPTRLPRRRGYRRRADRRGKSFDLRRDLARRGPQRRRGDAAAAPAPPPAPAPRAAADRRVRLDEAAHRRAPALRPCARRRDRARRGVHHRHAADPRHAGRCG